MTTRSQQLLQDEIDRLNEEVIEQNSRISEAEAVIKDSHMQILKLTKERDPIIEDLKTITPEVKDGKDNKTS